MSAAARRLGPILLGCSLLATACESPPASLPAAPGPAPKLSICERAPRPAAAQDAKAEASFHAFSRTHLAKLRKAGAAKGKQIRDEFETELRATGDTRAPWVGLLRYCERAPSKSTAVTEIFRFEAGEWVY